MVTTSKRESEFVYAAGTNVINTTELELDVIKVGVSANLPVRMAVTHRHLLFAMPDSMTRSRREGRTYWVGDLEQRILSFCDAIGLLYQGQHGSWDGSSELVGFDAEARRVLGERLGEADLEIREFFEGTFEARGFSLPEFEEAFSSGSDDTTDREN